MLAIVVPLNETVKTAGCSEKSPPVPTFFHEKAKKKPRIFGALSILLT